MALLAKTHFQFFISWLLLSQYIIVQMDAKKKNFLYYVLRTELRGVVCSLCTWFLFFCFRLFLNWPGVLKNACPNDPLHCSNGWPHAQMTESKRPHPNHWHPMFLSFTVLPAKGFRDGAMVVFTLMFCNCRVCTFVFKSLSLV